MTAKNNRRRLTTSLKKIVIRVAAVLISLLLCLLLLELTLKTGLFNDADNPSPVWIPNKFKKIDKAINQKNYKYANLNPYGFTDKVRDIEKKAGTKRIAVLGDSFIWGYGLPYEKIWSHKLENMVAEKYDNFEVMSWGLSAWSTIDELSFLEKHGIKYDIDLLIVGFVSNDPDMGDFKVKTYKWSGNILFKALRIIFPDAINFIVSYTNRFLTEHYYKDHQYNNWEKALYSDENLLKYSELLQDFSRFCDSNNIELLFVLHAAGPDNIVAEKFNKITPLLEQAHIKYFNLLPALEKDLRDINPRKLWANPANGHPGDMSTTIIAKEVFNYLEMQGIFLPDNDSLVKSIQKDMSGKERLDIEALVNIVLYDDDWDKKKRAAIVLGEINNSRSIEMLVNALNDKNHSVRESAVAALGEINEPHTILPLINALKDDDSYVRLRALLELGKKNDPRIIEPMITAAIEDDNQYVRRRALLTLSKIKDSRIVECLIQCLKDKSYFNRSTAVIALGKTKDPRAVAPLVALLNDEIRGIRAEIAEALGEIGGPHALEALMVVALKDNDPYVRDLAAKGVKKLTGKDYARYRRKLLRVWQKYF